MKVALSLALLASTARADDVPARARLLADHGRMFHDRGDYASAIAAFTEAYALAPSPALLFNLAQAYRLAGSCDNATVMYKRYLASDPDPEARALAEAHLAAMQPCVPRADGIVTFAPEPSLERNVGAGLVIAGGVTLAVAGIYAWRASDDADQVSAAYAHGASWGSIKDVDERGRHNATMGQVFGGVGAAALAAGVVLYVLGDNRPVTVVPLGAGAEVRAGWRF